MTVFANVRSAPLLVCAALSLAALLGVSCGSTPSGSPVAPTPSVPPASTGPRISGVVIQAAGEEGTSPASLIASTVLTVTTGTPRRVTVVPYWNQAGTAN